MSEGQRQQTSRYDPMGGMGHGRKSINRCKKTSTLHLVYEYELFL